MASRSLQAGKSSSGSNRRARRRNARAVLPAAGLGGGVEGGVEGGGGLSGGQSTASLGQRGAPKGETKGGRRLRPPLCRASGAASVVIVDVRGRPCVGVERAAAVMSTRATHRVRTGDEKNVMVAPTMA